MEDLNYGYDRKKLESDFFEQISIQVDAYLIEFEAQSETNV